MDKRPRSPLTITTRGLGEAVVIRAEGELSRSFGDDTRFEDAIAEQIAAGKNRIVLDLEEVRFLDTGGLSVLVTSYKRLRDAGGQLVFLRPSKKVREILELTQLSRVFRVRDDDAGALAALQPE